MQIKTNLAIDETSQNNKFGHVVARVLTFVFVAYLYNIFV